MSQVKTNEFEGDSSFGRHVNVGGNTDIKGCAHIHKNVKIDGWLEARNIKAANKGIFRDVEKLRQRYPEPLNGWWTLVGDTLPAAVYVAEYGKWIATGKTAGEITVDVEQFHDDIEALTESVERLSSDVGDNTAVIRGISSDMGKLAQKTDGLARDVSALASRVTANESGIVDTSEKIADIKNSIGKAGGLAPLDNNRRIPSRYLPDTDCVCRFDHFIDDPDSSLHISDTPLSVAPGESVVTAWISRPDGRGCFAEAVGGGVPAALLPDGETSAATVWHTLTSSVLTDTDGCPWPHKIYICTESSMLYVLSGTMLRAVSQVDNDACGCSPMDTADIDNIIDAGEENPGPGDALRIDESEIDALIERCGRE